MSPSYVILYCSENQDIAQKFYADLSTVGATFQPYIADQQEDLNTLRNYKQPIIALISDNFLKNEKCLKNAMLVFADLIKVGQMMILVVEGRALQADGSFRSVQTQFERVSNVIQYMNYWQDAYLEARKKHNHNEMSDADLNTIREISNQIGDFIRLLRESNYHYFENIVARNYLQFCQLTGLPQPSVMSDYKFNSTTSAPKVAEVVTEKIYIPTVEKIEPVVPEVKVEETVSVPEIVTEPVQEVVNQIVEEEQSEEVSNDEGATFTTHGKTEEETIDDLLSDLPGIEMLKEKGDILPKQNVSPAKEIDEDDFFNPKKETGHDSNINQIIDEIMQEEDGIEEDDEEDDYIDNDDLANIFNKSEKEVEEYDKDEEDDFASILRGNFEIKEDKKLEIAEPTSDVEEVIPNTVEDAPVLHNEEDEEENENLEIVDASSGEVEETAEEEMQVVVEDEEDNQDILESLKEHEVEEQPMLDTMRAEVNANPENLRMRLRYAVALAQLQNNWQEATKQVAVVLESDPQNPDANFLLGEMAEVNRDYLTALTYYERVASFSPFYPNINAKLAFLTSEHLPGQEKLAKKYFKKAIEQEEGNAELTYQYATFLNEKMNDGEKAIKYFKKTLKIDSEHPFAYYDLAVTFFALGDPYSAQTYYEKACVNNPELKTQDNDDAFRIERILSDERAEEAIHAGTRNDSEVLAFNALVENSVAVQDKNGIFEKAENKVAKVTDAAEEVKNTAAEVIESPQEVVNEVAEVTETVEEDVIEHMEEIELPKEEENVVAAAIEDTHEEVEEVLELEGNEALVSFDEKKDPEIQALMDQSNARDIASPTISAEIIGAVNDTEVIELEQSAPRRILPNPNAKIVLITGATSGIGRATAEILAKEGYNLILTGRRAERLKEIADKFNHDFEGSTITLAFDVRKMSEVAQAVGSLDKEWFDIDVLINNAGLGLGLEPIHEGVLEQWETMIDTNIKGLLYMTRLIAPRMVENCSGHIINLCSTAGKEAYANGNVYCATKFAVDSLTKSMRLDLHKYNIRVSQVAPGAVEETEFSLVRFEGNEQKAAKVYDNFQALRASDVADVIYFIISRPSHVNIQDVLLMGTQQASATVIDRSGRA